MKVGGRGPNKRKRSEGGKKKGMGEGKKKLGGQFLNSQSKSLKSSY